MQLVHDPADGDERVLATAVETADTLLSQARGLMFRRGVPDDYALVFWFDGVSSRDVHMLFVPFPIDVVWTVETEVQHVERLRPWLGFAREHADALVELPAGAGDGIEPGDRLRPEG